MKCDKCKEKEFRLVFTLVEAPMGGLLCDCGQYYYTIFGILCGCWFTDDGPTFDQAKAEVNRLLEEQAKVQ